MSELNPLTIISADGVAKGHLTDDDVLVIAPNLCEAPTYPGTLETPPEYCDNKRPCSVHPLWDTWQEEYISDDWETAGCPDESNMSHWDCDGRGER